MNAQNHPQFLDLPGFCQSSGEKLDKYLLLNYIKTPGLLFIPQATDGETEPLIVGTAANLVKGIDYAPVPGKGRAVPATAPPEAVFAGNKIPAVPAEPLSPRKRGETEVICSIPALVPA